MKFNLAVAAAIGAASANKIKNDDPNRQAGPNGVGQPKTTTMQPLNCMYFELIHSDDGSTPMVLNCDDQGCGLEEFVWDDKDQMFWWDATISQEWGKIIMFNKEWDKTKPVYLTYDPSTKDLKTTDDKLKATDFFYEMRDSTL